MPTSLVTGGAGFIGSHVAEYLVQCGHRVVVLDDLSGGFKENVPAGAQLVVASILERTTIENLFKEFKFDYVFHLAAYAAEGLSSHIKRFNYVNNLIGSVNLINASVNHDVKRFVFTSSIAVYGSGQTPFSEDMIPAPEDSYGIAKYAVEQELQTSYHKFGLEYTIFRPHNVYGERQNIGDRYRNVVGIFMNQCLRNEPMTIFGSGGQLRAFTYIGDVAPIIADCVNKSATINQVYNIGAEEVHSVNHLARQIAGLFAPTVEPIYLPARDEVEVAFSDHSKLNRVYGMRLPTHLSGGLKCMANWVKDNGARESKPFKDIEITKNLPPSWANNANTTRTSEAV